MLLFLAALSMERRSVLQSLGIGGSIVLAGTSGCLSDSSPTDTQSERELVVTNEREQTVLLGVRVEDQDGESLFSHVYEIEPGKTDETTGDGHIETQPDRVVVFTPNDEVQTWDYSPETDLNCDIQDIGIRIRPEETIEFYNSC